MKTLRAELQELQKPVEVDAIETVARAAERALREATARLTQRVTDTVKDLGQQGDAVLMGMDEASQIHETTSEGQGVLATLRSTVAHDQVDENRQRALRNLNGVLSVLIHSVRRALMLSDETQTLGEDLDFGIDALEALSLRASGADLVAEAQYIQATLARLKDLEPRLRRATGPLSKPVMTARSVVAKGKAMVVELRGSTRAATLGESLLDEILPADGGEWTQAARRLVGDSASEWVPNSAQKTSTGSEDSAEIWDDSFDRFTEAEQRDEALRRAAEEELDALE